MRSFLTLTCAAAMLAASAEHAAAADRFAGAYEFRTHDMKNGVPVCTEQWDFGDDGKLTIHSGQEVVSEQFRLEHDTVGDWIVATVLASNFQPDCMGTARTSLPTGEERTYWFAMNDGTINICAPPATEPVIYISNCYATLRAVAPKN